METPDLAHVGLTTAMPASALRRGHPMLLPLVVGAVCGLLASILRLGPQAISGLVGGLAFWATVGFLVSRSTPSTRKAVALAVVYLATWLATYYITQRLLIDGASSRIFGAAVPWMVLLLPGGTVLGLAATASRRRSLLGDFCLALPMAGAAPEFVRDLPRGPLTVTVGLVTVCVGALPLIRESRRGVNLATVGLSLVATAILFTMLEALVSGSRLLGS